MGWLRRTVHFSTCCRLGAGAPSLSVQRTGPPRHSRYAGWSPPRAPPRGSRDMGLWSPRQGPAWLAGMDSQRRGIPAGGAVGVAPQRARRPVGPEPVLRAEHLVRRFGDRVAVSDVGFAVAPGETYGLLGPNGAGKTTTIRLVCGLVTPDSGRVSIGGHLMDGGGTAAKALVGYVPQY